MVRPCMKRNDFIIWGVVIDIVIILGFIIGFFNALAKSVS